MSGLKGMKKVRKNNMKKCPFLVSSVILSGCAVSLTAAKSGVPVKGNKIIKKAYDDLDKKSNCLLKDCALFDECNGNCFLLGR